MFGQQVDPPAERDLFIYGVALEFRDSGLCQKIPRYALGSEGGFGPAGYQISYLQSQCYYYLADTLHDASLCDNVRPLSKGFLDGSKFNPQDCRARLHSGPTAGAVGGAVDPHIIVAMMRKLGYVDQDIPDFQYRNLFNSPIHDAYKRLRQDGLFAERVKAAPTFDEPVAAIEGRPANELEYLYQMFAVDTDDSTFCGKISPNAEAEWPNHNAFMLRLGCYRDVAYNKRDLTACKKLPARSSLPPGATDRDSRENCSHYLGLLRPDLNDHSRYGPAFPPTFSSFQKALHELGYDLTFPELTGGDYGDFLRYLSDTRQPNAAARAEFLRRVAAME